MNTNDAAPSRLAFFAVVWLCEVFLFVAADKKREKVLEKTPFMFVYSSFVSASSFINQVKLITNKLEKPIYLIITSD